MAVSGSGTLMITGECIKLASVSANGENPDEYTCPAHFYWPRETSSVRQVLASHVHHVSLKEF